MRIKPTVGRALFLLWSAHMLLDFFTGIWPLYKTMAGMDLAKAGLIGGISGCIGESTQLFFGYFCDRGYRKLLMILGLLLASSILWVTCSQGSGLCFVLLLLLMLGSASFHPASVGWAGMLSPEKKGRNILLFASGGAIGLAFSQVIFTGILSKSGGHALILLIPTAILVLFLAFYPLPEQMNNRSLSLRAFLQPLLKNKRALFSLYATQVLNYTLMTAWIFLLPDLMRHKGCHHWLCMGGGHLSFILGSALMMVPAGHLSDKFHPKPVLLIVLCCALFSFYTFLMLPTGSTATTIGMLALTGGLMGTINPILVSWGNKLVPESPSTVSALMMGCAWSLASLGATWAGLIANTLNTDPIRTTLLLLGTLLAVGFFLILLIPQPIPEDIESF
ncbi:MAG: MFS transporter [Verrucomicrobia bacterium]|nr:MFS transporter [Verrucomicrobiota bacterium]